MAEENTFDSTIAGQMEAKALDVNTRDKPFIIFQDQHISFGEFYRTSSSYAHLFQTLHNAVPTGDKEIRAAVFMDNHPAFLFTKEEMEKLRVEFKENGREQLLDAWR